MYKKSMVNNVVSKETLRKVQKDTLEYISNVLLNSFGPKGSNSCIQKKGALNQYTKDGHTILSNITFNGAIEQSIKEDLESITRHIVKTVGDGTTSAVILSKIIFNDIIELEKEHLPSEILKTLDDVCRSISNQIKMKKSEVTDEDIYNISMISTNGDKYLSNLIKDIYTEMGMSVFIDVSASTGTETFVKYYDGMTINTGFSDSIYVNNPKDNTCTIDYPEVYYFEHPIDTREMSGLFDAIIVQNIIKPMADKKMDKVIPTVIIAPRLSQDLCGTMNTIVASQTQLPPANRIPLLIISDFHQINEVSDLAQLCGAKPIRKYIDAEIYKKDVAAGTAPTTENLKIFCGMCDQVVADAGKTKFIRPENMYDNDGNKSTVYNNLLEFLKVELKKAEDEGADLREIGTLKRRIHSLESNMVEIFVGGITAADRDSKRDLLEDAVLNCRSATNNGIGFGANCEALFAIDHMKTALDAIKFEKHYLFKDDPIYRVIFNFIHSAYYQLVETLYKNNNIDINMDELLNRKTPINIVTGEYDNKVLSSLESDIVILNTVCKIVGIMATCNQFVLPDHMYNVYENLN